MMFRFFWFGNSVFSSQCSYWYLGKLYDTQLIELPIPEPEEHNDKIAGVPMQDFNMEPPEEEIIFESAQNDDADVVQNEEQEEENEENKVVKTRHGRASNKTSWMVPTFKGKRYDHATFAVILTNIIKKMQEKVNVFWIKTIHIIEPNI